MSGALSRNSMCLCGLARRETHGTLQEIGLNGTSVVQGGVKELRSHIPSLTYVKGSGEF